MKMDRKDERAWDPGFTKGGEVWNVGKQKNEDYDPFEQAKPKPWTGF